MGAGFGRFWCNPVQNMSVNDLRFHIKSLSRAIYVRTDEEDHVLHQLAVMLKKNLANVFVFAPPFGLRPLTQHFDDWMTRKHDRAPEGLREIPDVLTHIYKHNPAGNACIFIILEADRWLMERPLRRQFLNILHQ